MNCRARCAARTSLTAFKRVVWAHYHAHGRHELPWRKTHDVYKILVSEVMLQQTQVERVIPFYKAFIKKFPTARALAGAPLARVLAAWSGLGYNRRAKLLRAAAKDLSKISYRIKKIDIAELEALPGVGPYTARAVAAFAYNANVVFVETNIRTAVIHQFFTGPMGAPPVRSGRLKRRRGMIYHTPHRRVTDTEIEAILEKVLPQGRARAWYSALMDYGAHLKRSGVRVNAQSAQYAKQAKFEGSLRQVRGAIIKALTAGEPLAAVKKAYPERYAPALAALEADGLIKKKGRGFRLA